MTYKRRCENWITSFGRWTLPRSEAQESFIFWTSLFSMASALRRQVVLPKTVLGSWEVFPHMYVMFISPAGRGRKTTTMTYADDLLDELPDVTTVAQAITQQDLMKKLANLKEPSISIRALEFGTFYKPSQDIMIDFLTALFDGRKRFDSSTLSRGTEFASKPCCNMLAATTPKWLNENLTDAMIGGGFMSRVVPIYEDTVRRRQLYYEELDYKALEKLREDLVCDLNHFASEVKGEFRIDSEAKAYSSEWYKKTADLYEKEGDLRLQGYYERKPAYAFKLAMLLHIARSDELVITLEDFQQALVILEQVERKMSYAYHTVTKNPYTDTMDRIEEFIQERGKVTQKELLGRFYHEAQPDQILLLVQALMTMERITANGANPGQLTYRPINVPRKVDPSQSDPKT